MPLLRVVTAWSGAMSSTVAQVPHQIPPTGATTLGLPGGETTNWKITRPAPPIPRLWATLTPPMGNPWPSSPSTRAAITARLAVTPLLGCFPRANKAFNMDTWKPVSGCPLARGFGRPFGCWGRTSVRWVGPPAVRPTLWRISGVNFPLTMAHFTRPTTTPRRFTPWPAGRSLTAPTTPSRCFGWPTKSSFTWTMCFTRPTRRPKPSPLGGLGNSINPFSSF